MKHDEIGRYRIKRGYPAKSGFAGAVFKEYGIDAESIARRVGKMEF